MIDCPLTNAVGSGRPPSGMGTQPMRRIHAPAMLGTLAAMGALGAVLCSCNIITPAMYLLVGKPKLDAEHKIADRPTVVFVDDRANAIEQNSRRTRQAIAEKVSAELMIEKLVETTIRPADAMAVSRQRDRQGAILAMDEIGEAVGAEQVIYVEMLSFRGTVDGMPRPNASCRVRVIDVINRKRLFPAPDALEPSRLVQVFGRAANPELYRSRSGRRQLEESLANQLGDRIAKLFYKHVPDELGSRLGPQ